MSFAKKVPKKGGGGAGGGGIDSSDIDIEIPDISNTLNKVNTAVDLAAKIRKSEAQERLRREEAERLERAKKQAPCGCFG